MERSPRFALGTSPTAFALALAAASFGCGGSTSDTGGAPFNTDGGGEPSDAGTGHEAGGHVDDGGTNTVDSSVPLPEGVVAVPLHACVPLIYAADFGIGSQSFRLIVDTGSTSLGVAGSGCSNCNVSPLYSPGSTAVDQKKSANAQFGSGSWSGKVYEDSVGPTAATSVPVKIVSITSQNGFFQPGSTCGGKEYHGLLGLSQPASAVQGTNGFFDQYVATKGATDVFAHELCDDGGTLWLGGYDANATSGPPQWVPFTSDFASSAYYAVNLESITVEGTNIPIASGQYQDSIVDSGTSVFLLGSTAYDKLAAALQATAGFKKLLGSKADWFTAPAGQPSCANLSQSKAEIDATLPALTIRFAGGATAKAVATESYLMPYPGAGYCNSLISQPQSQQFPIASLMGAPILRSSVVIYDRAQKRVGFAPHKGCAEQGQQRRLPAPSAPVAVSPRIGYPLGR